MCTWYTCTVKRVFFNFKSKNSLSNFVRSNSSYLLMRVANKIESSSGHLTSKQSPPHLASRILAWVGQGIWGHNFTTTSFSTNRGGLSCFLGGCFRIVRKANLVVLPCLFGGCKTWNLLHVYSTDSQYSTPMYRLCNFIPVFFTIWLFTVINFIPSNLSIDSFVFALEWHSS